MLRMKASIRKTDQMTASDDQKTKKPTLKTIAQLTGLAVPTISRALGGAEDISVSTRARVRRVADEIGYVPNRAGVRLRTGRTNVISLVLSSEHELMNHTAKLISSVAGGLRHTPYHLIITPYFVDEDPLKPVRYIVETGSADAVILNQIKPDDPRVVYLLEKNFPFVTHGRTQWSDKHAYADFDNGAFAQIAVRELAARGRRQILLIAPPDDQTYAQVMIDGAKSIAAELGLSLTVLPGATSDAAIDVIEAEVGRYLSDGHVVDAVVCPSSNSSLAVISAVEDVGLVIGDTVDLFSKEVAPLLKRVRKEVMTVSEDIASAGDFMVQAAIQRIKNPTAAPMQYLQVPTETTD